MSTFVIILHVVVSIFLILVVLLQPGGKGGMGSAFGGAGGATVFGGRGANTFLAKLTAAGAVVFMLTSFSLVYFSSRSSSVMDGEPSAPVKDVTDGAKGEVKDEAKDDATNGTAKDAAATDATDTAAKDAAAATETKPADKAPDAAAAATDAPATDAAAKDAPEAPRPLHQGLNAEQLKEHAAEMDAKNKAATE